MFYASLHWNSFENDFSFRPRTQSPTHTHTDAHRSEVNLLDVLYALNGRRTSSSSNRNRNGSGNGNGSLLNSCSALLSGSSARVPAHLLLLGLLFVCLLVTPTSNHDRQRDQESRRIVHCKKIGVRKHGDIFSTAQVFLDFKDFSIL